MLRLLPAAILFIAVVVTIDVAAREFPNPSAPGAMGSALSALPDGRVVLSWLEPDGDKQWTLKFSLLDSAGMRWTETGTIARGDNWFINWADFPSVAPLSESILLAIWFVENPPSAHRDDADHGHGTGYHAQYSLSDDTGSTWSAPQPITGESAVTEFAVALPLGHHSRALVAWLDGRDRAHNGGVQKLYAQTLLADGADALVDGSVCDCCQLSLALLGDDDALIAYRGRTSDEIRDIRLARWRGGRWETPRTLHDDHWKIAACPVNGPRLAAQGNDVLAVWFTAPDGEARVLLKRSHDGGATFGDAQRVDLGRALGRVDALMFADRSAVVTWLEANGRQADEKTGGIYLRRVAADGTLGEAQMVAASTTSRAAGFPRLAALKDGRVLLTYTLAGEPSRVVTALIP